MLTVQVSPPTHTHHHTPTHTLLQCSDTPPQPPRPSRANAELYVCDHDLHHSAVRSNYGKRLSLWDKVFGPYWRSWGTAAHGEAPAKRAR